MKKNANVVIIGAGIVGCSSAYHLAQLGWKDMLILDQGDLFHTGGSTSHAPGTLFQLNPCRMMTGFSQYTHDLYDTLSVNGVKALERVGTLQLAHTKERLADMKRLVSLSKSMDLETTILSPQEAQDKLPILSIKNLKGALYTPSDGVGRAVVAAEAMANYVIEQQAGTFHGRTIVERFDIQNNTIKGVITNKGTVRCDKVLLCGGIWGPKLGDMLGINVPLQPTEHLYSKTNVIEALNRFSDNGQTEITLPSLRTQDYGCYYRQHYNMWGIGNYHHKPLSISAHDILPYEKDKRPPSKRPFTAELNDFAEQATAEMFPCTQGKGYSERFNGIFSFLPDGYPLIGESSQLKGLWSCEAVWIMHSGGAGKAIAEWMDQGRPSSDMHNADFNRFSDFRTRSQYVKVTSEQSYREVHDIIHPHQPLVHPVNLRRSPFYHITKSKGAEFFEINGWTRPQWFKGHEDLGYKHSLPDRTGWESEYWSTAQAQEHLAVRNKAGVFDLSAFTKIKIEGTDALAFLQKICVNDIDIPINHLVYTSAVNALGTIESDFTITRLGENEFFLLCGAAVGSSDLAWLKQNITDEQIYISDMTSSYAALGVFGPQAMAILREVTDEDISDTSFPYYTAKKITIHFAPVQALRLSYVGEAGCELYCPPEFAEQMLEKILSVGEKYGLIMVGNGAMDSLRMEKAYRAVGSDLNADYNPYQAGLGWTVKLNKAQDFIGKSSLAQLKEQGLRKKLCMMKLLDNTRYPIGGEPIMLEGKKVGYVTSTNSGYSVGYHLAFGYLPIELSAIGTQLAIEYFGRLLPVEVCKQVQYDAKNERMKTSA